MTRPLEEIRKDLKRNATRLDAAHKELKAAQDELFTLWEEYKEAIKK